MSAAQTLPLFLSVAMAASQAKHAGDENNEESTSTPSSKATPNTGGLSIKNTFIDVEEDLDWEFPQRRASSAPPPQVRPSEESTATSERVLPALPILVSKACKSQQQGLSPCASTVSLTFGSHPQSENEISDAASVGSDSSRSDVLPMCGYGFTLAPAPQQPLRPMLSSGARAWVPSIQSTSNASVLPPDVRMAFAEVIAAGLAALKTFSTTKVTEDMSGWTLSGYCQSATMLNYQSALSVVQDKLLQGAEKSSGVYVVGYETTPFKPAAGHVGFSAQLALVQDESSACWDLLAKGHCQRGCTCRWQHPQWQVGFTVQLVETY